MSSQPTLPNEMRATADALRQVRTQLTRLVHDGHLAVLGSRETALIVLDGPNVADALECIAGRLTQTQP